MNIQNLCINIQNNRSSYRLITIVSDTECIDDVDVSIVSGSIKCFCPILCRENLYVSSISTSTWPGEKFLTKVQQLFSGREGLKDAVENASSIR